MKGKEAVAEKMGTIMMMAEGRKHIGKNNTGVSQ